MKKSDKSDNRNLPSTALGPTGVDMKGHPVAGRISTVAHAIALYQTLRDADEQSSAARARLDALFDGASPYDQAKLTASGQGMRTNLNFGDALRLLDISLSGYVDLDASLERLVSVTGTTGSPDVRHEMEDIVAEEITRLLRSWPLYHSSYMRLCTSFVKHGVGVAYFDGENDWRFRVGSLSDVLIPRQTPASEEEIDVAVIRREYTVAELHRFITDEAVARKSGWNVGEVRRVLVKGVTSSGSNRRLADWETLQAELKNNDIVEGARNPSICILHFLVREATGEVSHLMCAEDSPADFLFRRDARYSGMGQVFTFFTHSTGTNGTYHSVRGLGQRIFTHCQWLNRLRSQQVDGAMLASALILQPESQRAIDELAFTYFGPYALISPGVTIVDRSAPDLTRSVGPAIADLTRQLAENAEPTSAYGTRDGSSPYRNQMQVASDIDVASRLSGATLNLFYASWGRHLSEIVRRIVTGKRKDPAITDFIRRCAERGVPEEFIRKLDTGRTRAVHAIGGGSAAGRVVALTELRALEGALDETGRRNLVRDIFATRVGHDLANRYVPGMAAPRPVIDTKVAILENSAIMAGDPVPVLGNEIHAAHLAQHLPVLQQVITAVDEGNIPAAEVLPAVTSMYTHLGDTLQFAGLDPALDSLVGQARQLMQHAEELIHNTQEAQQKDRRDAAAGGAPEEGQAPKVDPSALRLQEHEVRMRIAREKADLDMAIRKGKFDQEQVLRDARVAAGLADSHRNGNS